MVQFTALIKQFAKQGEKTGWTYIEIPAKVANLIKPATKKSFRVKGKLDHYAIKGVSLLPMGEGAFIMALNATMRKGIKKRKGATIAVQLTEDKKEYQLNADLVASLEDEPAAYEFFKKLPRSVQNYYSKWIESAKTEPTKVKRIAMAVDALAKKWNYGEMLRAARD
jgi:hypothetical protein